jgi:hypothetical protein
VAHKQTSIPSAAINAADRLVVFMHVPRQKLY